MRLPRTYRGRDVLWWMDASGVWDERYDEVDDLDPGPAAALAPAGRHPRAGHARPQRADGRRASSWSAAGPPSATAAALFSGGLRNVFSLADLKMRRLLDTFDEWARPAASTPSVGPPERFAPTRVPASPRLQLDLPAARSARSSGRPATGPTTPGSTCRSLDAKGQLRHDGGVVDSPGLYALGLPVLRRRKSTFIHGIEDDAREVIDHLAAHLAGTDG